MFLSVLSEGTLDDLARNIDVPHTKHIIVWPNIGIGAGPAWRALRRASKHAVQTMSPREIWNQWVKITVIFHYCFTRSVVITYLKELRLTGVGEIQLAREL